MTSEQINSVISTWDLKIQGYIMSDAPSHWSCGCTVAWMKEGDSICPQCMATDYLDHSAWDDEMFAKIEDAGDGVLMEMFTQQLYLGSKCESLIYRRSSAPDSIRWGTVFAFIKSSPLAKATALAMAITEARKG